MIKVNGHKIDFEKGMTVADALQAVGKSTDAMTLVMVDGKVLPRERLHKIALANGKEIKLLPIISGG